MNDKRVRIDKYVSSKLGVSREEANRIIKSGGAELEGIMLDKPGGTFEEERLNNLKIAHPARRYVGRGGEKLETALGYFKINLRGRICLDVGASTGGFTDCMLKSGASRVYAIENGSNQLAQTLRENPRVVSHEETDIRSVPDGFFQDAASFAAVDVSFISMTRVLEKIVSLLAEEAEIVLLVKPQFETGAPGNANKRGVLKDKRIIERAIENVTGFAESLSLKRIGMIPSPVETDNKEYLLYLSK